MNSLMRDTHRVHVGRGSRESACVQQPRNPGALSFMVSMEAWLGIPDYLATGDPLDLQPLSSPEVDGGVLKVKP